MKLVNNLTKATIKNHPCFVVREDLNFEDDGNHFKGFEYVSPAGNGSIPITTLRSDGQTYLNIREDYIRGDYTSQEWWSQPESRLTDEFNGCDAIEIDKLIANCEAVLKAINRLKDSVKDEVINTEPIKEALFNEIIFGENFLDKVKRIDWINLTTSEMRNLHYYANGIKNDISRAKSILNTVDLLSRAEKKCYLDTLNTGRAIVINNDDYYIKQCRSFMAA